MKLRRFSALAGLAVFAWAFAVQAADDRRALDRPVDQPQEPVVIPEYQPDASDSEIVIRPGENEVFYEYRVNGELREIKVVPNRGPAYYLVPADGGGWIREDRSTLLIPSWVIFRW
ncbi:DUF2782 domain-containing protein [uncultured Marinobacter sp.]|uniref:DUF2782 domain-containing protein n=1 Tax=uncultured Marinobacter sp. TaxID=187379 RepID=UPI0030D9CB43